MPDFSPSTVPPGRIHGLDTLRALAVTLVVLHHYVLYVSERSTFGWLGDIGWVGVDLFFALSGYLIGKQIIGAIASPGGLALPRFYGRRLLRTLPSFLVVLAIYYLSPWFRDGAPMLPLWRFLTFTQNLLLAPGSAFSHAWSLCIEEQFYLLLPALALALAALGRRLRLAWPALAWIALGAGVLLGVAARGWLWRHRVIGADEGLANYFTYIYYFSPCRLDELLAGVALALTRVCHPALWRRLASHGNAALAAALAILAGAFWWFLDNRYGEAVTLFGYPLLALGFGLLLLAALDPASLLGRWRVPGAGQLALWSYAVYLVHRQVSVLAARPLAAAGFGAESPVTIVVALSLSVLGGALLYALVERPCMRLRERWLAEPAAASAPAVSGPLSDPLSDPLSGRRRDPLQ